MRAPYRVDPGLDQTDVYIRRPPRLRHHQPMLVIGGVLVVGGLWMGVPVAIGLGVLLGVAAGYVARQAPADHHLVKLRPAAFEVDGVVFDTGSLSLVLTDEKLVLRDTDHQAELWHGIPRLSERMALRKLLEGALDDAKRRQGKGREHVPPGLERR